jgi:predicted DNA-binding protein YlxM (UPF0122 family)
MAFIINRNFEITETDFSVLKQRFNVNTRTQAVYKCVDYVVNQLPEVENTLTQKEAELETVNGKFDKLIESYKRKQAIDSQIGTIVYPEQQ